MKHLKKFNESLNFEKGYSRVSNQSKEMEYYWSASQIVNKGDFSKIQEWMRENEINCEVSLEGRTIDIIMKSGKHPGKGSFQRLVDLGLDEYRHQFHGRDISKKMIDVSSLLIWEGAPNYDPDNRGYFNVTIYTNPNPRLFREPVAYFTCDSIYGLMDFFEDFFKGDEPI